MKNEQSQLATEKSLFAMFACCGVARKPVIGCCNKQ
jgi:hypothetical protein